MTALEDIQLKRQQAANNAKERRDRAELAQTVVDGLTDKGIRVNAVLDASAVTESQERSLNKLQSVISQLENSGKTADDEEKSLLKDLIAAVKAIESSPVVNVPAPVVNIPAQKAPVITNTVDLEPLQATLQELLAPEDAKIDLDDYRAQDLKESGDVQYVGFVNPAGSWYIIENDTKKNQLRYLFGAKDYAKHFKKAPSYVYRLMNEAVDNAV